MTDYSLYFLRLPLFTYFLDLRPVEVPISLKYVDSRSAMKNLADSGYLSETNLIGKLLDPLNELSILHFAN